MFYNTLDVEIGHITVVCDIAYNIIKGERYCSYSDGSYHPDIPDELDIVSICIQKVYTLNSYIPVHWLDTNKDWDDWLKSVIEEKLMDYDLDYHDTLLYRYKPDHYVKE